MPAFGRSVYFALYLAATSLAFGRSAENGTELPTRYSRLSASLAGLASSAGSKVGLLPSTGTFMPSALSTATADAAAVGVVVSRIALTLLPRNPVTMLVRSVSVAVILASCTVMLCLLA